MSDYTLYHGDCLDVLPTLDAQSVDAVICDPPYGTTACKWDSVIPFEPMWKELKRIIKPRGAIVLFGSQPFTSALVMSNPKWFRYEWVWEKDQHANPLLAKQQPLRIHETICVFCKYTPMYNYQPLRLTDNGIKRNNRNKYTEHRKGVTFFGDCSHLKEMRYPGKEYGYPKSIIRFAKESNNQFQQQVFHPTQKPLALLEYLVKTYTNEGDTILDFTMGSGTTGHACANTGRRFIGIEKDAGYFEIAQRRIASAYAPLAHMEQVA